MGVGGLQALEAPDEQEDFSTRFLPRFSEILKILIQLIKRQNIPIFTLLKYPPLSKPNQYLTKETEFQEGQSMARPLRIELSGGLYNLTSRGNERRAMADSGSGWPIGLIQG